jgi:hypothetical protein
MALSFLEYLSLFPDCVLLISLVQNPQNSHQTNCNSNQAQNQSHRSRIGESEPENWNQPSHQNEYQSCEFHYFLLVAAGKKFNPAAVWQSLTIGINRRWKVDRIVLSATGQLGSGPAGKFELLDFVKPETRVQKGGCSHDGDNYTQASAHHQPGRKRGEAYQEFREVCTLLTISCHLKLLSF